MISIRRLLNKSNIIFTNMRLMSVKSDALVDISVDNEGIAVLTMQRPPVNSLNLELLQALSKSLEDVEKDRAKAIIFTSASPTVFSAGLDIMEMYKPDIKRATTFWSTLQDAWLKLYGSRLITAAAINGHSPAGGCLLACSCEYRVMVSGKYSIGLNETGLGIVAPKFFMDTLLNTIPARQAELALTLGKLFTVDEALKVGLIDETANDKNDAVEKCKKFIRKFDRIPSMARSHTKLQIRAAALKSLQETRQADLDQFLGFIGNAKIQQSLEFYINQLKQKSAK